MEQKTRTVLLLGRPGSGKGTQTELLAEKLGWKTFSTGNVFRELRDSEGSLGERVRETYDAGLIMPNWFPTYLFLDTFLKLKSDEGIICEGYARTVDQAEIFHEALEWLGRDYVVYNLEVSEEEALRRQLGRHAVDARPDSDTPEKLKKRFEEYENRTAPVVGFFKEKGTLVEINGEQTPDKIAAELLEHLTENV